MHVQPTSYTKKHLPLVDNSRENLWCTMRETLQVNRVNLFIDIIMNHLQLINFKKIVCVIDSLKFCLNL